MVPDLPKTRSGKIMRRLLRDVAEGRDLGDTTTLADAGVVEAIRDQAAAAPAGGLTRWPRATDIEREPAVDRLVSCGPTERPMPRAKVRSAFSGTARLLAHRRWWPSSAADARRDRRRHQPGPRPRPAAARSSAVVADGAGDDRSWS